MKRIVASLGLAALVAVAGCGVHQGPRIHFATATEAQLAGTENERVVWYEFRKGDEVPMAMLYTGVVEGESPMRAKATQTFWLVVEKNAPPRFSFDGEHVVDQNAGSAAIALGRKNGENRVGVVVYLGKPEDAPAELRGTH
jgi:hypothetical protein